MSLKDKINNPSSELKELRDQLGIDINGMKEWMDENIDFHKLEVWKDMLENDCDWVDGNKSMRDVFKKLTEDEQVLWLQKLDYCVRDISDPQNIVHKLMLQQRFPGEVIND